MVLRTPRPAQLPVVSIDTAPRATRGCAVGVATGFEQRPRTRSRRRVRGGGPRLPGSRDRDGPAAVPGRASETTATLDMLRAVRTTDRARERPPRVLATGSPGRVGAPGWAGRWPRRRPYSGSARSPDQRRLRPARGGGPGHPRRRPDHANPDPAAGREVPCSTRRWAWSRSTGCTRSHARRQRSSGPRTRHDRDSAERRPHLPATGRRYSGPAQRAAHPARVRAAAAPHRRAGHRAAHRQQRLRLDSPGPVRRVGQRDE